MRRHKSALSTVAYSLGLGLVFSNLQLLTAQKTTNEKTCNAHARSYLGFHPDCSQAKNSVDCLALGSQCAFGWSCDEAGKNNVCAPIDWIESHCDRFSSEPEERKCQENKTPDECAAASGDCSWCADPDFKFTRCNVARRLTQLECSENGLNTFDTEAKIDPVSKENNNGPFNIGPVHLKVRGGMASQVNFEITESADKPIDIYVVMDMSYSMKNIFTAVKASVEKMFSTLTKTSDDIQIGYGQW